MDRAGLLSAHRSSLLRFDGFARDAADHVLGQGGVERPANEPRDQAGNHRRGHERQHHGSTVEHFHHDNERCQRGLCHCGQEASHTHRDECRRDQLLVSAQCQLANVMANARANG